MTFVKGQTPKGAKVFKPGESGNPNGRPSKLPNLDKILANVLGKEDANGITKAEKIIAKLSEQADNGNVRASEIILDRGWGKPKQFVENTNLNVNADMSEDQLNERIRKLMDRADYDSDNREDQ